VSAGFGLVGLMAGTQSSGDVVIEVQPTPVVVNAPVHVVPSTAEPAAEPAAARPVIAPAQPAPVEPAAATPIQVTEPEPVTRSEGS
jgi:hypothetical protein